MRKVLALVAATVILAGCGGGDDEETTPTPSPSTTSPSADPEPSPSPSADVPDAADLLIAPGAVGDARVGMTVDEALDTGLFDADVPAVCEEAPNQALGWKPPLDDTFDVYVADDVITSIGIRAEGPTNAEGLGVGSTLADFTQAYDTAEMHEAGYGQTGLYLSDGTNWLGVLLDSPLETIDDATPVTFMEVTDGNGRPSLIRDGC